jgi:hypothetical protein
MQNSYAPRCKRPTGRREAQNREPAKEAKLSVYYFIVYLYLLPLLIFAAYDSVKNLNAYAVRQ